MQEFCSKTKLLIYMLTSRSDNKETIIASLSKESILKRRRRNTIGIQITVITWMFELLANIIAFSRCLMWVNNDAHNIEHMDRISILFGLFVQVILIPSSYLLNSEAVKLLILAKGWTTFLGDNMIRCLQRNRASNEIQPIT